MIFLYYYSCFAEQLITVSFLPYIILRFLTIGYINQMELSIDLLDSDSSNSIQKHETVFTLWHS